MAILFRGERERVCVFTKHLIAWYNCVLQEFTCQRPDAQSGEVRGGGTYDRWCLVLGNEVMGDDAALGRNSCGSHGILLSSHNRVVREEQAWPPPAPLTS